MCEQDFEHLIHILIALACGQCMTQHYLLAAIMLVSIKSEMALLPASMMDSPASQRPRHFLYIPLRVPAIYAQRVQFHQFAGVILIRSRFMVLNVVEIR